MAESQFELNQKKNEISTVGHKETRNYIWLEGIVSKSFEICEYQARDEE